MDLKDGLTPALIIRHSHEKATYRRMKMILMMVQNYGNLLL
ncbi:hypothetical protein V461_16250 [Pantoea ananatis BRT98]|nr:hypothetical protein V461_16250 [Pantoea ananatis BRT98]